MALITNEGSGCAVIFHPEVVQKRRQHFRDSWGLRIENMVVCVITGRMCVGMVVHASIVDGEYHRAKREDTAEGGNT
jgi:hypothetical protein